MRDGTAPTTAATGTALFLLALLPAALHGQPAGPVPVDTAGLSHAAHGRMEMLLEKSIFNVNVLSLDLRFGTETAARLRRLTEDRAGDGDGPAADSLARAALDARDAWARVEYHRGFGFDRFLEGTRRNLSGLARMPAADSADLARISDRLSRWHRYFGDRGVREGDVLHFRIRGDTVRSVLVGPEGEVVADTVASDPLLRLAVLGRYFAPGSDFRDPLLRSLPR